MRLEPCGHPIQALIGDEHGHFTCQWCAERDAARGEALREFSGQLREDCLAMSKAEERILLLEAEVVKAYEESAVIVYEAYSRSNSGEVKFYAESAANRIRILATNRLALDPSAVKAAEEHKR